MQKSFIFLPRQGAILDLELHVSIRRGTFVLAYLSLGHIPPVLLPISKMGYHRSSHCTPKTVLFCSYARSLVLLRNSWDSFRTGQLTFQGDILTVWAHVTPHVWARVCAYTHIQGITNIYGVKINGMFKTW